MSISNNDTESLSAEIVYIHNSLNFRIRPDLSSSNNDIELLSGEIVSNKSETQLLLSYTDHQMVK